MGWLAVFSVVWVFCGMLAYGYAKYRWIAIREERGRRYGWAQEFLCWLSFLLGPIGLADALFDKLQGDWKFRLRFLSRRPEKQSQ